MLWEHGVEITEHGIQKKQTPSGHPPYTYMYVHDANSYIHGMSVDSIKKKINRSSCTTIIGEREIG